MTTWRHDDNDDDDVDVDDIDDVDDNDDDLCLRQVRATTRLCVKKR